MKTTSNLKRPGRKQKGFYQRGLHTEVLPASFTYQGKYCIYGLASSEKPNVIRYVGYTSQKLNIRYNDHINARAKQNPKQQWVNELIEKGHKLHMIVLEEGIQFFEQACEREEHYIKILRYEHPLTNVASGGVGTKGMKHSEETRLKQSQAHQNKVFTMEHRGKISASQRNRHQRAKEARQKQNEN